MMKRSMATLALLATVAGCGNKKTFHCTSNAACGLNGECVEGYCAFPASFCGSNLEWDKSAGPLAGQCVPSPEMGTQASGDMVHAGAVDMAGDQGVTPQPDMAQPPGDMAFDVSKLKWTVSPAGDPNVYYSGVSGTSASDVWIVGIVGTSGVTSSNDCIVHYTNGTPSGSSACATSIFIDQTDVIRVGLGSAIYQLANDGTYGLEESSSTSISRIGGVSGTNLWATATAGGGVLRRSSANTWGNVATLPGTGSIGYAIWASSATDIYVVGSTGTATPLTGTIWHSSDGSTFAPIETLPADQSGGFTGVWGSSADDVYAVGGYEIAHYNGSTWTAQPNPCSNKCGWTSVHGSARGDVWVVGPGAGYGGPADSVSVAHSYGDGNWTAIDTGVPNTKVLNAVWASSSRDVWIAGNSGTIVHGAP